MDPGNFGGADPAAVPDAGRRAGPLWRGTGCYREARPVPYSGASGFQKAAETRKNNGKDTEPNRPPKGKPARKAFPKPSFGEIREALQTLWPPLKKALNRTRRGVRIDPLDLSVILGGQTEPADAARLYGELHGAVWAGMPVLERLLVIPHPHIHLDVDFTAEETKLQGTVGISARIGTLLRIGMTAAIPVLRWLLAYLKKKKQQAPVGKDESDGNGKEQPAA